MSSRKYQLARPTDNDNGTMLFQSMLPSTRVIVSNNSKLCSKSIPIDKAQTTAKSSPRWWLVLPCLLLMNLASSSDSLLMNDLIVHYYERRRGLSTTTGSQHTDCSNSLITTTTTSMPMLYWQYPFPYPNSIAPQSQSDYNLVQSDTAKFNIKNSIATLIPSVVTFLLYGANSDSIGRRPLLVLPFAGKVFRYASMLIIVYRNLSDGWIIGTHVVEASFGAASLITLGALAYITDCTNKTRTRSFFIAEVLNVIARILPMLGVSIWLRHHSYTVPLSIDLTLSVIGLLYALLIQPESIESMKNISFLRQMARIRLKPIMHIITLFTIKRSGDKRKGIILLTIVTVLLTFTQFGYHSIFTLYLYGHPFCFDAFHVGLLSTAQTGTIFAVSMLIILCKKLLKDSYVLPIFGTINFLIGLVLFGIAKKIWLLYIAVCIGSVFFVTFPVLRTKLTNLVKTNEYAVVFIAAGVVESIGNHAMSALTNGIYKSTLKFFPGLIFLIFAIIGVFPLVIMGYLAFIEARVSRNVNKKSTINTNPKFRWTLNKHSSQI